MKVKISYSVDKKEILTIISKRLEKESLKLSGIVSLLKNTYETLEGCVDGEVMKKFQDLEEIRESLYDVDVDLGEMKNLLQGYIDAFILKRKEESFPQQQYENTEETLKKLEEYKDLIDKLKKEGDE